MNSNYFRYDKRKENDLRLNIILRGATELYHIFGAIIQCPITIQVRILYRAVDYTPHIPKKKPINETHGK